MKRIINVLLFLITIILIGFESYAGGLLIHKSTLLINDRREPHSVDLTNYLELEFMANQYTYGRHGDRGYIIFVLNKILEKRLNGPVGPGKTNERTDIEYVQKKLAEFGYWSNDIDGKWSTKLEMAIKKYQVKIGFKRPDGIIGLGGLTENSFNKNIVLIAPLKEGGNKILYRLRTRKMLRYLVQKGKYILKYQNLPVFLSDLNYARLPDIWFGELRPINIDRYKRLKEIVDSGSYSSLGEISIGDRRNVYSNVALYLELNDKTPGLHKISYNTPLIFSWSVQGDKQKSYKFRYRLLPDTKWSSWSEHKKVHYFFMAKGNYTFEVECRATSYNGKEIVTSPAKYEFNLNQPLVAMPDSATLKGGSENYENFFISPSVASSLYNKKYALLVGVESFSDMAWSPLPYTTNDVKLIKESLQKLNFKIYSHVGVIKSKEIVSLVKSSIKSLKENDLLVVYISSHGFNKYAAGYIAGADCKKDKIKDCVSLNDIEELLKGKNHNGKHVLILLDTCSSGLGVINKSSGFPERDMVTKKGVIMITAGLENQQAQMINDLKSSVFTYYLNKGLAGEADLLSDGIITTTELLLYVRYNVAKYTNGMQIPMMGRISGSGEMVFNRTKE